MGIILLEEKASSFDEISVSLHHGTPTFQYFLPPAGADSLEMIHAVVEQNRLRDRERIEALEEEVAELREAVGLNLPPPRNITKTAAKKEIGAYFAQRDGEIIYPSDIAEALNLDYDFVLTVTHELEKEGKVTEA